MDRVLGVIGDSLVLGIFVQFFSWGGVFHSRQRDSVLGGVFPRAGHSLLRHGSHAMDLLLAHRRLCVVGVLPFLHRQRHRGYHHSGGVGVFDGGQLLLPQVGVPAAAAARVHPAVLVGLPDIQAQGQQLQLPCGHGHQVPTLPVLQVQSELHR